MKLMRWVSSILSVETAKRAATSVRSGVASIVAAPEMKDARGFCTMFGEEIGRIRERRRFHGGDPRDPRRNLVGLALSGGGIRSATFCLGFLQGLDQLKLLRLFDYLSTVSGGGFVGAWWSAWLSRPFVVHDVTDAKKLTDAVLRDRLSESRHRERRLARARQGVDADALERLRREVVDELNQLASDPALAERVSRDINRWPDRAPALQALLSQSPAPRHLNARLLETLYKRYLQPRRLFPPHEELEASRVGGYLDPKVDDAGLTGGRDPVHHLRLFSNYLTPRKGLLSGDTWLAIAVVSRNLLLTWILVVPALITAALLGQLYFVVQPFSTHVVAEFTRYADPLPDAEQREIDVDDPSIRARVLVALRPVAFFTTLVASMTILWMRYNNAGVQITHVATLATVVGLLYFVVGQPLWDIATCHGKGCHRVAGGPVTADFWGVGLIALVTVGLWLFVRGVWPWSGSGIRLQIRGNRATQCHTELLVTLVLVASVLLFTGFAEPLFGALTSWLPGRNATVQTTGGVVLISLLTAFATVFTALKASPAGGRDSRELARPSVASQAIFAVTPPLVLVALSILAAWASRGLLSFFLSYPSLDNVTFAALSGIGLCVLFAWYEVVDGRRKPGETGWKSDWIPPLGLLVLCTIGCYFLLGSPLSRLWERHNTFGLDASAFFWYSLAVAGSAGVLFYPFSLPRNRSRIVFLGSVCLGALLLLELTGTRFPDWFLDSPGDLRSRPLYVGIALATVMATWVLAIGWMADPNALSLHTFYKVRLIRAYLGASNPRRNRAGKDIRDAVEGDDFHLSDVITCERGGPYPLVNTTLNLVGGHDLSTAQRSSAAFVLSPLYCGSVRTRYRPTSGYMSGELSLGAAVAASGAAVSPNMGARTPSAALSALLAFLNVRLGLWAPSPHKTYWDKPQTRLWPYYVLRESFSQTTIMTSYCYLTDGGHFDNTGLYSLVERGCLFIVVVDNGADPRPCFEDLGDAIRRCRIDFRAEIELDVSPFQKSGAYRLETGSNGLNGAAIKTAEPAAQSHYVVGTVTYDRDHLESLDWEDVPAEGVKGTLVWFKPALVSGEPADVRQYGLQNAYFPHQSTVNQWFDESQFESYRKLGELYALEAFGPAKTRAKLDGTGKFTPEQATELFAALRAGVPTPGFVTKLVDSLAGFVGRLGAVAGLTPSTGPM